MADSLSLFQQLPDSVLLHIFSFLDGVTLTIASSACVQWNRVASDEVLWRDLVTRVIKKNAPLAQDKISWRGEYKRLLYHVPTELSQEVTGHTDEVYFLSFSPSGRYLASVGKDGTCRVGLLPLQTSL
ncbi:F-box/WD repeat-containing protein 5-like [Saccostrea cucullata]|uniref:F-box/WD repeat-containing protein 5-like n=1 Tax=Saccostrea cuccullata TaxID=36930 RepID=UPI002ED3BA86